MVSLWRLAVLATLSMALPACGSGSPTPPTTTPPATQPPVTQPPVTERNVVVVSTDVPKDIPNRTTTQSVVDVAAAGVVLDVIVDVVISHTWRGDLELRLRHPDGVADGGDLHAFRWRQPRRRHRLSGDRERSEPRADAQPPGAGTLDAADHRWSAAGQWPPDLVGLRLRVRG